MLIVIRDRLRPIGTEWRFVILHLVLSRVVYLTAGVLTALLVASGPTERLEDLGEPALDALRGLLFQGDSYWYGTIVDGWYEAIPFDSSEQRNWAFFPLFPAVVRIIGGSDIAGLVVANVCLVAASLLLASEVRTFAGGIAARWTVLFLLYWPLSGMLSSYRPEPLLLLLLVATWASARRRMWFVAWALVALATLTRPQGILAGLLLLEPMWAARAAIVRRPLPVVVGAALPLIALGVFSWHLGSLTGDPLAWAHIQVAWGRPGIDPLYFIDAYWPPLFVRYAWDFSLLNLAFLVLALISAVALATMRRPGLALFTAAWAAGPVLLVSNLIAMGRWLSVAFTIPLALATHPRLRRARLAILIVFVTLLAGVAAWTSLGIRAVMP